MNHTDNLPHGLLQICLLDGNGGLQKTGAGELDNWTPEKGCLWLHFDLTSDAAAQWLRKHPDLDPIVVEALLTVDSRPRLSRVGSGALLAFRGVNLNEGAAPADMIGIRLWLDEHLIITTQRRSLRSVTDLIESLEIGEGPGDAPGVVVELTERLVSRMSDTVDDLEEKIADLESTTLEEAKTETRSALSHLRRQLIALRRYLAPQREALSSLATAKFSWLDERDRLALRETGDQLIRHLEDLDAIRERAAVTQEELQNRLSEQQNVRMYVLSIVAAIFLPLGFLTGLLGINVGGIPGAENSSSFLIFVLFLIAVVTAQIIYFRIRKWF